jgi:hypothetical protein
MTCRCLRWVCRDHRVGILSSVNKWVRYVGLVACFVSLTAMTGGHWLALQSVAWARMIVAFSQEASLQTAVAKTFDGRHPCPICLQVRKGWGDAQQEENRRPMLKLEKAPEFFWEIRQLTIPSLPIFTAACTAVVPRFVSEFISSPPTPPPRWAAVL